MNLHCVFEGGYLPHPHPIGAVRLAPSSPGDPVPLVPVARWTLGEAMRMEAKGGRKVLRGGGGRGGGGDAFTNSPPAPTE